MRRNHVVILLASTSSLLSVLLAVAVNVATGGALPGPLSWLSGLAWPLVGLLALVTTACRFAISPTSTSPPLAKATTDGVIRPPRRW